MASSNSRRAVPLMPGGLKHTALDPLAAQLDALKFPEEIHCPSIGLQRLPAASA